jgi:hypothetical protein
MVGGGTGQLRMMVYNALRQISQKGSGDASDTVIAAAGIAKAL